MLDRKQGTEPDRYTTNALTPVYIEGKEIQRVNTLKRLGVSFDRSLCGKEHISEITITACKGLIALKTMA